MQVPTSVSSTNLLPPEPTTEDHQAPSQAHECATCKAVEQALDASGKQQPKDEPCSLTINNLSQPIPASFLLEMGNSLYNIVMKLNELFKNLFTSEAQDFWYTQHNKQDKLYQYQEKWVTLYAKAQTIIVRASAHSDSTLEPPSEVSPDSLLDSLRDTVQSLQEAGQFFSPEKAGLLKRLEPLLEKIKTAKPTGDLKQIQGVIEEW